MTNQKNTKRRSWIRWFLSSKMSFFMTVLPSLLTLVVATGLIIYLGERDRRAILLESQMLKTKSTASRVKEKIIIHIHDPKYKRQVVSSQNPMNFGFQKFPEDSDIFIFAVTPENAAYLDDTQDKPKFSFMYRDDRKQLIATVFPEDMSFDVEDEVLLFGERAFIIPSRVNAVQSPTFKEQGIRDALESKVREGTFGLADNDSFKITSFLEIEGTNITVVTHQTLRDHFAYYQTPLLILFLTFSVILAFAIIMQKIIQSRLSSSTRPRIFD